MKVIRIGRDPKSDYVITHPAVSGNHADIYVFDNGAMQLIDHSTNGTYVDGGFVHNGTCFLHGSEILVFPDQKEVKVSDLLALYVKADTSQPEDTQLKTTVNSHATSTPIAVPGMSFVDTLGYFFNHYTDFDGRARRQEYWYMCLWNLIFFFVPIVNILWGLAALIPMYAMTTRRLHDINKSGWCILLAFIPIVGAVLLFVWTLMDSDPGVNKYGNSPKYPSV